MSISKCGRTMKLANIRPSHGRIAQLLILVVGTSILFGPTASAQADHFGHSDCPCIDAAEALAGIQNCLVNGADGTTIPGFFSPTNNACTPLTYGGNKCGTHDLTTDPKCISDSPPTYCFSSFCYVDIAKCRGSNDQFYKSALTPPDKNLYWSYSTCDSSGADSWFGFQTIDSTLNQTLTVAFPGMHFPLHYKRDSQGNAVDSYSPEAFDNSIPWQGHMVDYFDAVIIDFSNVGAVNYVHQSGGSRYKNHTSAGTRTLSDVQAEIVDVAIAPFWVTAERLAMTPFTSTVTTDPFKLWIPQPKLKEGSFGDNAKKIMMPFSKDLWFLVLIVIVSFAFLSVLVSPDQYRGDDADESSNPNSLVHRATIMTDSLNVSFLEFMGGGVDYRTEANAAQKLLNFGFAFTVFIVVTAYTANLAAFLTISGTTDFVSSIREATNNNWPICAPASVVDDLSQLHPDTIFVSRGSFDDILEAYDTGRCKAILMGWVDIRMNPRLLQDICDRELVRVGETIMNKHVAFPARSEIVAGLSHWLMEAETQGISFDTHVTEREEAMCNLEIVLASSEEDSEVQDLTFTPANLVLPLTVFGICCAMAVVIHFGSAIGTGGDNKVQKEDALKSSTPSFADKTPQTSDFDGISVDLSYDNEPRPHAAQNHTEPFVLPQSSDMDTLESAEEAMQQMLVYQHKILGRIKRLARKEHEMGKFLEC